MRIKPLQLLISISLMLLMLPAGRLWAVDANIIRLHKTQKVKGGMFIQPPALYVKKDAVVIWMSLVQDEDIQIVFEDGKRCMDVSYSPSKNEFSLDTKSCFVHNFLSYASTTSLKFLDTGTFEYLVYTKEGKEKAKGKIIVRDP